MTRPFAPGTLSLARPCGGRGKPAAQHLERKQARAWFARLLWRAFPACRSERALCERAAGVLECSPSSVRNYLRETHDAPVLIVLRVLALAGASVVLPDDGGEG